MLIAYRAIQHLSYLSHIFPNHSHYFDSAPFLSSGAVPVPSLGKWGVFYGKFAAHSGKKQIMYQKQYSIYTERDDSLINSFFKLNNLLSLELMEQRKNL